MLTRQESVSIELFCTKRMKYEFSAGNPLFYRKVFYKHIIKMITNFHSNRLRNVISRQTREGWWWYLLFLTPCECMWTRSRTPYLTGKEKLICKDKDLHPTFLCSRMVNSEILWKNKSSNIAILWNSWPHIKWVYILFFLKIFKSDFLYFLVFYQARAKIKNKK